MLDLETRIRISASQLDPAAALRMTVAIRTLDRVGIQASLGSSPTVAEMDEALRKAGVTDPVKRLEHKISAERLAKGIV